MGDLLLLFFQKSPNDLFSVERDIETARCLLKDQNWVSGLPVVINPTENVINS